MGTCVRQPVGVGLSLEFVIRGARFDSGRRAAVAVAVAVAVAGASLQKLKVIPGRGGGTGYTYPKPGQPRERNNQPYRNLGWSRLYILPLLLLTMYIYILYSWD